MSITFEEAQDIIIKSEEIISASEIQNAYDAMGKAITYDLELSDPLVLVVMNGALIPAGQLLTRLNFPFQIGYLHASRYNGNTEGAAIEWIAKPSVDVKDRVVLLVEDIFDEGTTLKEIVNVLQNMGAQVVYTAALVNKVHDRKIKEFKVNYIGVDVPDRYIFGCGMDYHEYWRNLPGIWALKE